MTTAAQIIGGNKAGVRSKFDLYETPAEVTLALLREIPFHGAVWEPACGNGKMVEVMWSFGCDVVTSDLHDYGGNQVLDFLATDQLLAPNIVTNPPFSLAEQFIRHAYQLRPRKMAFLLKATFWHARRRLDLFWDCAPGIILPLTWRMDCDGRGRPTMDFMWVVWCPQEFSRAEREGLTYFYTPLRRP